MSKTTPARAFSAAHAAHPMPHSQAGEAMPVIETLVQQYYSAIRCLARSILMDENDAEDAAQETFIQAALKLEGFRGEAEVKTWLYAIAINECRGRLRKRQVRQKLHALLHSLQKLQRAQRPPLSPEDIALQHEAGRELWKAVDELETAYRLPVLLRYVHDLTVPQIAQALGLPEGTVHSRLHRARLQLQEKMKESHP